MTGGSLGVECLKCEQGVKDSPATQQKFEAPCRSYPAGGFCLVRNTCAGKMRIAPGFNALADKLNATAKLHVAHSFIGFKLVAAMARLQSPTITRGSVGKGSPPAAVSSDSTSELLS